MRQAAFVALCLLLAVAQATEDPAASSAHEIVAKMDKLPDLPESCNKLLSEPSSVAHLKSLHQLSNSPFLKTVLLQTNQTKISHHFPKIADRLCNYALSVESKNSVQSTLTPKMQDTQSKLGEQTLLVADNLQAETDVFVSVLYVIAVVMTLQGMYARMWCENFLLKEKEEWDESNKAVDANYLPLSWEKDVLEGMANHKPLKIVEADKEDTEKKNPQGMKRIARSVFSWYHEGGWPTDGQEEWIAPMDPFDTVREHHEPAAQYIRVYCQEMHYSLGWRLMGIAKSLFRSSIQKPKHPKKAAEEI